MHRDPFDRHTGVAEQPSRGLDPNQFDGPRRSLAGVGAVVADEAAVRQRKGRLTLINAGNLGRQIGEPLSDQMQDLAFPFNGVSRRLERA